MRYLLDTHTLLWWFFEPKRLPAAVRAALSEPDNHPIVSVASAFEIALKHRRGKLPEATPLMLGFESIIASAGFGLLEIRLDHALEAGRLASSHGDPFDRLLIAQALIEQLVLVSGDSQVRASGVPTLW